MEKLTVRGVLKMKLFVLFKLISFIRMFEFDLASDEKVLS